MTVVEWEPYITAPSTTAEAIAEFERTVDRKLPQDYVDDVLNYAGFVTEPESVPVGKGETSFGPLYYFDKTRMSQSPTYNIFVALDNVANWVGRPNVLIPFATNTATGEFCFDYRAADSPPKIVFADLGYDPEENNGLWALATTYSDLLGMLR